MLAKIAIPKYHVVMLNHPVEAKRSMRVSLAPERDTPDSDFLSVTRVYAGFRPMAASDSCSEILSSVRYRYRVTDSTFSCAERVAVSTNTSKSGSGQCDTRPWSSRVLGSDTGSDSQPACDDRVRAGKWRFRTTWFSGGDRHDAILWLVTRASRRALIAHRPSGTRPSGGIVGEDR